MPVTIEQMRIKMIELTQAAGYLDFVNLPTASQTTIAHAAVKALGMSVDMKTLEVVDPRPEPGGAWSAPTDNSRYGRGRRRR